MPDPYYVTTPIYYVNDRPHIGHCYTTLIADVAARMHRLIGRDVFFLTGTDEHAEKVVARAVENGVSPQEWADRNAAEFRKAFEFMNFSNDDFVRTTEDRHKTRASAYIQKLVGSGDIELGDYEGWWDGSQEEYLTETVAKEHDYKSPVTGRPLEKRTEQNYFFRLDKYQAWLEEQISSDAVRVLPEARKNEVLGRIRQGLQKVPVSRRIKPGDADWGVKMPNDPEHRVYVWIEALCNYLTVVDTVARRKWWPRVEATSPDRERGVASGPTSPDREGGVASGPTSPDREGGVASGPTSADREGGVASGPTSPDREGGVASGPTSPDREGGVASGPTSPDREGGVAPSPVVHLMAKDILWFHAVIWPAMLKALGERPPKTVYAHAYFISEGRKMSKSLGNFIEIDQLRSYAERYSLDALRWFLVTQGPLGANDADFAYQRFVEVYNADLANGIGNATSRVSNMIAKYFGGKVPEPTAGAVAVPPDATLYLESTSVRVVRRFLELADYLNLGDAFSSATQLVTYVDRFINETRPFSIAKQMEKGEHPDPERGQAELGTILYLCAEALRIASLLLYPAMPEKMADLWRRWNCNHLVDPADCNSAFAAPLGELAEWGGRYGLKPGQEIVKGDALFMRADVTEPAPGA